MAKRRDTTGAVASLLGRDACTDYLVKRDLLKEKGKALEAYRQASLASPLMKGLVAELGAWPGKLLSSHKSPDQCFHLLALAAELGLRRGDPGADGIAAAVMSTPSEEGPFGLPSRLSPAYGGTGESIVGWALCDAPVTLRSLLRMGYGGEAGMARAIAHLVGLAFGEAAPSRGWPCVTSASLGGWRGPGKKADPCPYGTLVMVELLAEEAELGLPAAPAHKAALLDGSACLLGLWEKSATEHPFIFYMGSDFRKLKAPLLWYDLLHVLDALTRIPELAEDPRLAEMLDILEGKAGPDGLFTPESVYQRWKAEDFGQKKAASGLVSAFALRAMKRGGRLGQ
jgi:hypothetical protein